jgi:hypothetical protein
MVVFWVVAQWNILAEALKMEVACSFETLEYSRNDIRSNNPEAHQYSHRRENIKS